MGSRAREIPGHSGPIGQGLHSNNPSELAVEGKAYTGGWPLNMRTVARTHRIGVGLKFSLTQDGKRRHSFIPTALQ